MGVRLSLEEIKNRLINIFGDKYEFDFSNFINTHSKIGVKCQRHGLNQQTLKNLLKGHGCKKCGNDMVSDKQRNNIDEVISKFKKLHGDRYGYSKFNYIDNRTKSTIICPIHGEFYQSSSTHNKGHGCPSCSGNRKLDTDRFINIANKTHNNNYIYDFVEYKNMHSKVKIFCPKHGEFYQLPLHHIKGIGCPKCNQSKGERMIEIFLKTNNIDYISQKKFEDCKHITHLVFDFYLPSYNTCIEFNGIQHYFPIDIFGGDQSLEINKKRDKIKYDYCKSSNINLIIIKQDKKHINLKDVEEQISDKIGKLIDHDESI